MPVVVVQSTASGAYDVRSAETVYIVDDSHPRDSADYRLRLAVADQLEDRGLRIVESLQESDLVMELCMNAQPTSGCEQSVWSSRKRVPQPESAEPHPRLHVAVWWTDEWESRGTRQLDRYTRGAEAVANPAWRAHLIEPKDPVSTDDPIEFYVELVFEAFGSNRRVGGNPK